MQPLKKLDRSVTLSRYQFTVLAKFSYSTPQLNIRGFYTGTSQFLFGQNLTLQQHSQKHTLGNTFAVLRLQQPKPGRNSRSPVFEVDTKDTTTLGIKHFNNECFLWWVNIRVSLGLLRTAVLKNGFTPILSSGSKLRNYCSMSSDDSVRA